MKRFTYKHSLIDKAAFYTFIIIRVYYILIGQAWELARASLPPPPHPLPHPNLPALAEVNVKRGKSVSADATLQLTSATTNPTKQFVYEVHRLC